MKELPREYIIQQFMQYAGFPKPSSNGNYMASCTSCREGKSFGRKRRLYYIPTENIIHCHNCVRTWNPINWIMEQSGMSFKEVMHDAESYFNVSTLIFRTEEKVERINTETLPKDCIDLTDEQQVRYYSDEKIVTTALSYIKDRRLNTAINKPDKFYISLNDYTHKNRLVIPFQNAEKEILWYQTRAIRDEEEKDRPKYLSKYNAEKTVFGIDRIDPDFGYIFIFEGPIDAMFIKNGVAMAGITMSEEQKDQISKYTFHEKIWVLDNELKTNKEVKSKMEKLINEGERVFIWPDLLKFKDINAMATKMCKDSFNPEFFIKHSYSSNDALIRIS